MQQAGRRTASAYRMKTTAALCLCVWLLACVLHVCVGQDLQTIPAFEKCLGGQFCSGKQACFIIRRRQRTLDEAVFPLRNCGQEDKEEQCICLPVGVSSQRCNAASNCSMERTCTKNKKHCSEPTMCVHVWSGDKLDDQLCNHVVKQDKNALCRCATPDKLLLRKCEAERNCERGMETCQIVTGYEGKRCIGRDPSPLTRRYLPEFDPDNLPAQPCVDARWLRHLGTEQLVYKVHKRAAVLCDEQGSCATAGHIVQYGGEYMAMRTYCEREEIRCNKKVRFVNSPRMTRGMRVESGTRGLMFTALAARYGTRIEEGVLTLALRVLEAA